MTEIGRIGLTFLVGAMAIVAAGTVLARSGDVMAARTRLGGVWVGSVLLALATSLPEATTDVAAVRIGAPDLAAGDLFGSSMANMLILALLNLMPRGGALFQRAALEHALYASLAMVVTCLAAVAVLARSTVTVLGVGIGSLLILAAYLVGSRAVFRHSVLAREATATTEMYGTDAPAPAATGADEAAPPSLRRAVLMFVGAAVVILIAAPQFARSAERLAVITGIGTAFMGTWLVGLATSLPELVTSLAAVRMRAFDLAVGNLFGSNAFNMAIFVVLDVAHPGGPILGVVSPVHAISALVAILLMAIGVAALVYRSERRVALLEPGSGLMIIAYALGLGVIFLRG